MRKLASIQKVTQVDIVEKSDNLELTSVLGWKCATKKGEFKVGDLAVYIEIDSILPEREPFMFLASRKFKIKTMKFNKFGIVSQGILFPISILPDGVYTEGQDVTEIVGVKKFEVEQEEPVTEFKVKKGQNPIINFMMRFKHFRDFYMKYFVCSKGNRGFPEFISKTDETRIQNLSQSFENEFKGTSGWSISEKMEGQSLTCYLVTTRKPKLFGLYNKTEKEFGVCSRNLYLPKHDCNWWRVAIRENIHEKLSMVPFSVAIQGEICGPSIQGNIYKFDELKLFIFNVKNLETGKYMNNTEIKEFCIKYGLEMVPIIEESFTMPETLEEVVKMSTGYSMFGDILREGLIFRKNGVSFKSVSPEYLLKNEK